MNIFEERKKLKPYEYPQLELYGKAILKAFWEADHFTYDRDVKDFNTELTDNERNIVERSMLSIAVVENKVKSFWARIDQKMPKTEISNVGYIFAMNEVVHQDAYSKLLTLLNLNDKFDTISEIPAIQDRIVYLSKYLDGVNSKNNKEFTKSLILFTLLVENCSLFTQFLTISSFCKYKNKLKNFDKVISATAREEQIHGKFGAELIKIIKKENPDWFDDEMEQKTYRAIKKAYDAEVKVLNWIFENGELEWISKLEILEFLKYRLNDSLIQMDYKPFFDINPDLLNKSNYLELAINTTNDFDFFDGKSTDYSKKEMTDESMW